MILWPLVLDSNHISEAGGLELCLMGFAMSTGRSAFRLASRMRLDHVLKAESTGSDSWSTWTGNQIYAISM